MKKYLIGFTLLFAIGCGSLTVEERHALITGGLEGGMAAMELWAIYDSYGGDSEAFRKAIKIMFLEEAKEEELLPSIVAPRALSMSEESPRETAIRIIQELKKSK